MDQMVELGPVTTGPTFVAPLDVSMNTMSMGASLFNIDGVPNTDHPGQSQGGNKIKKRIGKLSYLTVKIIRSLLLKGITSPTHEKKSVLSELTGRGGTPK